VCKALLRLLKPYAAHLHSLTTDNGSEFAQPCAALAARTGCAMFVCDAHSPWQRGQVEGENKNIRQYLPKGFDVDRLSYARLASVQRKLNLRPKQVLHGQCPLVVANYLSGVALRG
jgi:transposase, IS30 family